MGRRSRTSGGLGALTARGRRLAALPREELTDDPQTGVDPGWPGSAMCVRDVDVQCALQFTLLLAAGCALHRRTSRVIHRVE